MNEKVNDGGEVKETRATYRLLSARKDSKTMREAARRMDEIRSRHANDGSDGKTVVELLRELRNR